MADATVAPTSRVCLVLAGLVTSLTLMAGSAGAQVAVNLKQVAMSDLGGPGIYGDVTVVGTTAVVATEGPPSPGSACPTTAAQVVDLGKPRTPAVVASIALPVGMSVALDAVAVVDAPTFTGDLLAVALTPLPGCGAGGRGAFYHLPDAAPPPLPAGTARAPTPGS